MFMIIGLIGSAVLVAAYWMLQDGRLTSDSPKFYAANGIGALMLAISIGANYDSGDLGGIIVECIWIGISVMGLVKYFRKGKAQI